MPVFTTLNELRIFMLSQNFDKDLSNYKSSIYPIEKLPHNKAFGPFLSYILDWQTGKYEHLSEGVLKLTGYGQEYIDKGLEGTFQAMHRHDQEAFKKMSYKWMELLKGKPEQEFNRYSCNFNFRIIKKNGLYLNLLQQPVYTSFDRQGNMVYEAGVITDITRYRSDGNISLVIFGPDGQQILAYYPKEDFAPDIAAVRNKLAELDCMANRPDNLFLSKIVKVLADHAGHHPFNVERFSDHLNVSRSQLYRNLKTAVDLTPQQLIMKYRLQQALEYLAQNELQVSEIAHKVGFNSLSYFSECFRKEFKCTPSDYQEQVK